jgi:CheY-like chemotaxis protein
MAKIRNELSDLRADNGNNDLFLSAIEQLDALSGEIAEAADKVMTAGEAIQKSAGTDEMDKDKVLRAVAIQGADVTLSKPFTEEDLIGAIDGLLPGNETEVAAG